MYRLVEKKALNDTVCRLVFEAPDLARAARPGQFVILRIDEAGERFPLTLFDWDLGKGTVTVVCQAVGKSTRRLCALSVGSGIRDLAGPLGQPAQITKVGHVVLVGGGVGAAEAAPVAKAMCAVGNRVTAVVGARSANLLIGVAELREAGVEVVVTTDDGSAGRKGWVTDPLREMVKTGGVDLVYAIGPAIMMKNVCELTRPLKVRTMVSLNSIMVDGTGMCGGCRVKVDGQARFACVDGPEFDGHQVDFEDLMLRQTYYREQEKAAAGEPPHNCRIGLPTPPKG